MTAIHAHRIEPLLGEWQLHETFDLMHPASILLREESQSVTTSLRVGTNRFLMSDPRYGAHRRSTATLPNDRSRSLVNHLHSFVLHPATVHLDFRDSSVDLTKIRRRSLMAPATSSIGTFGSTRCWQ